MQFLSLLYNVVLQFLCNITIYIHYSVFYWKPNCIYNGSTLIFYLSCRFFIFARDHIKTCCHFWNIYFWKFVLYEKYCHLVIMQYFHEDMLICLNFELMFFLLPEKSHGNLKSKLLVLIELFQNDHFLPCDLLGIITYFHVKVPRKFFRCNFCFFVFCFFATLSFFNKIPFAKKTHCTLHFCAFEKIPSFGHQAIMPLKHCICKRNWTFCQLHILMPDIWTNFVNTKSDL